MTKKKKRSALPKIEVLIILVLVFSFIMLAVMRCNETKAAYETAENIPSTTIDSDTPTSSATTTTTTAPVTPVTSPTPSVNTANQTVVPTAQAITPTSTVPVTVVSRLFVTLENLNLRTGPHLDSTIVTKLKLFDEVIFMNEVTDFSQKINLGPEIADDPWIKIKSYTGHVGWVYGAGLHYYKKRRLPLPLEEFNETSEETSQ